MPKDPVEIGKKIFESLGNPLVESLERQGITTDYLTQKLYEELEAEDTKSFCYRGAIIDTKPKPALDIRQRARQDAHKLMGHYPSDRHIHSFEGSLPIRQLTPEEELEVQAKMEVMKRKKSEEPDKV